ncbi:MAG: ribulokinase [Eubacteriales bacterium]|nr:ribulokinase [Eubacteriales bacterium]
MANYVLGVDFGTLSARALVAEVGTGRELASAVMEYPHAVLDRQLPGGKVLPPDWALQHPQDYIDCLRTIIPQAIARAGVAREQIIGVGVDCTASTVGPVDEQGTPLCLLPQWADEPHAWFKLWKHHGAQEEARRMTQAALARGENFLGRYGGKVSSEWMLPKIWETLRCAPQVYDAAASFVEAGDWIVFRLTGQRTRNCSMAGYKAMWNKREGYPDKGYLRALDPRLEHVFEEKYAGAPLSVGSCAGFVTKEAAELFGLPEGCAVAVANIDAHVSLPPAGLTGSGEMLMIMGTSTCHIMLGDEEKLVPGMCGAVEDGVVPGLIGYEAGQSCVGDHFDWLVKHAMPAAYAREAEARGMDAHALLTEKAAALRPGESGLIALDWWNGNRSVLVDADLTGLLVGLTLQTRAEEIYRALIEATAYGTRKIIEAFEHSGVESRALYACGGIAQKNKLLMQIYADVTGREIRIARSSQTPALGSAMFGAVAAGRARGGYDTIEQAAREMGGTLETVYRPQEESVRVYDELYAEYERLHDEFGRGANDVMKRLKALRNRARG